MIENLFYGIMPHYLCIGNTYITLILIAADVYIFFAYLNYADINRRIIKAKNGDTSLFKHFRNVFWTCGTKSLMLAITMIYPVYFLLGIITVMNAVSIYKANKAYKIAMNTFIEDSYTAQDMSNQEESTIAKAIQIMTERPELVQKLNRKIDNEIVKTQIKDLIRKAS